MTSGLGIGHPDWQAYANWRGDWIYQNSFPCPDNNNDVGSFVTTNWASLHFFVFPDFDTTLEIEWYADTAGTEDIAADGIDIPSGVQLDVLWPVRGQLAQVSLINQTGTPSTADITIQPSNVVVTKRTYQDSIVVVGQEGLTIPASGRVNLDAERIIGGPAGFSFHPNDSAGKILVDVFGNLTTAGMDYHPYPAGSPTTNVNAQLIFPESQARIRLINTDAAASHACDAWLFLQSQ